MKREKIGEGTFGTVFKVTDKDRNVWAVKKVPITIQQSEQSEIDKLQALSSDHIVELMSVTQIKQQQSIQIAMEFCPMNLRSLMQNKSPRLLNFEQILNFLTQITAGFLHIDQKNIIHLDLKPENILVQNQNHFKICDFGCSQIAYKSYISLGKMGCFGTPEYLAPQMYSGSSGKVYKSGFDVWSFGCILYEMAYGFLPLFSQIDKNRPLYIVMEQFVDNKVQIEFPLFNDQRNTFIPLIKKMLNPINENRPTFHEIKRFLIEKMNVSSVFFYNTKPFFEEYLKSVTLLMQIIDSIKENISTGHNSFWEEGKQTLQKLSLELILYLKDSITQFMTTFEYKLNKFLDHSQIGVLQMLSSSTKLRTEESFDQNMQFSRQKFHSECKKLILLINDSNKGYISVSIIESFLIESLEVDWKSSQPLLFPIKSFKRTVSIIESQKGGKFK